MIQKELERNYNLTEAAKILGVKPRTLRQWVHDHKIAAFRYAESQTIYFEESEIKRFVEARRYV